MAAGAVQERPEGAAPAVAPRPTRAASPWPSGPRRNVAAAVRRPFSESAADYAYVATDLRRIGVLVSGLVLFMIALSFVIR